MLLLKGGESRFLTLGVGLCRYDPILLAETSCEFKDRGRSFQSLARYIGVMSKPENVGQKPMAMTVPVLMKFTDGSEGQKIPMTAPVVTTTNGECELATPYFRTRIPRSSQSAWAHHLSCRGMAFS